MDSILEQPTKFMVTKIDEAYVLDFDRRWRENFAPNERLKDAQQQESASDAVSAVSSLINKSPMVEGIKSKAWQKPEKQTPTHILVIFEASFESEFVLAHIREIAPTMGARITLLCLLELPSIESRAIDPVYWNIGISESEIVASLDSRSQILQDAGLEVSVEILYSRQPEYVLQYAETNDVDIIAVAPPDSVSDFLISLIRITSLPLLVIKPSGRHLHSSSGYQRILVPLDGSQRAESPLNLALRIADESDAQIVLGHVVQQPEIPHKTHMEAADLEMMKHLTQRNTEEAVKYLEQVAARLPKPVETRVVVNDNYKNNVNDTFHELVQEENIDLIVLSAHGYSGEPKWPLGHTAENLLKYGNTPLMIVQDLPAYTSIEPTKSSEEVTWRLKSDK